jgi:hypothetical protein
MKEGKNKYQSRRDFVRKTGKLAVILPFASILFYLQKKLQYQDMSGRLILSNAHNVVSVKPIVF